MHQGELHLVKDGPLRPQTEHLFIRASSQFDCKRTSQRAGTVYMKEAHPKYSFKSVKTFNSGKFGWNIKDKHLIMIKYLFAILWQPRLFPNYLAAAEGKPIFLYFGNCCFLLVLPARLDSFAVSVFVVDVELTNTEPAAATPPTVMQKK